MINLKLKKFIYWSDYERNPTQHFTGMLEICPYEVELDDHDAILIEDIENFVEGQWTSFIANDEFSCSCYFFELESDAMAFKLRWS